MTRQYHIGCSGYYYPGWKKGFYPLGLKPQDWLQYYSSIFNTVELNGTFYRTPSLNDLKKYEAATPQEFRFSVKMSRYVSHVLRLGDCKKQVAEWQALMQEGLQEKLAFFLFQMPPSFLYTEENLDRILENVPHKPHNVIELRHISWWNADVAAAFKKAGLTFCNVDYPKLDTYFIHTSSSFYLRLHGNPALFKSPYTEAQLLDFYKHFPHDSEQSHIYFNNTYYDAAYKNAQQLIDITKNTEA